MSDWEKQLRNYKLLWISKSGDEFLGKLGNAKNDKAIPSFIKQLLNAEHTRTLQEIEGRIKGMKKKMYCGWQHDPEGVEKDICEECNAVNSALSDILSVLKEKV